MKTLTIHQDGKKFVIFADGEKIAGKQNSFLTKTDAENTIRTMIKIYPTRFKFTEK